MKDKKLSSLIITGDRPFVKRYIVLTEDRFISREEKSTIEKMTEKEFLALVEKNGWIAHRNEN